MLLQESLALAVPEAEEHHVHFTERHFGCEAHISIADDPFMYIGDGIAGVAFAVGKHNLCLRMVYKQPQKLTGCVAGCA